MKRPSTPTLLLVVAALLLIAACISWVFPRVTERTEIRNLSGQTVTNVVLELRGLQNDWLVMKRATSLNPGESLLVRHTHRDSRAVVTFAIAGRSFRHEEGYIDLWSGEGWRFDIQPGGTVTAGYDDATKH